MTKRYVLIDDDDADPSDLDLESGPVYTPGAASPPTGTGTGLLDAYAGLMESVTWRQRGDVNEYNEPTYIDSAINVIWFDDVKLIRNAQGEELQQLAYIQTTAAVRQGDSIIRAGLTWPIIGIQKTPTFEGEQFRIANLGKG